MQKIEEFVKKYQKDNLPPVQPGDTVRVYEKFFDRNKERIQVFEGIVIAKKHGNEVGATITVRRVLDGVGVEKTFPIHSPTIEKIEIVKRAKVRRAKLYYLRNIIGKIRLKRKNIDIELLQPKEIKENLPEGEEESKTELQEEKESSKTEGAEADKEKTEQKTEGVSEEQADDKIKKEKEQESLEEKPEEVASKEEEIKGEEVKKGEN